KKRTFFLAQFGICGLRLNVKTAAAFSDLFFQDAKERGFGTGVEIKAGINLAWFGNFFDKFVKGINGQVPASAQGVEDSLKAMTERAIVGGIFLLKVIGDIIASEAFHLSCIGFI